MAHTFGEPELPESWQERELEFEQKEGEGQLSRLRNAEVEAGVPVPVSVPGVHEVKSAGPTRVKITDHTNLLGTRVFGMVKKVCWGEYEGRPACLMVVRFRFHSRSGLFRLRKADVTINFDNYPVSTASADRRQAPVVAIYSPKLIYGIPTEVEHEMNWSVTMQCSVSAGPASMGPEASFGKTSRSTAEYVLEIAGMDDIDFDKDEPNKVIFEIDENPRLGRGVPRELYFGVVVEHQGSIQAAVSTSIDDRSSWPWTKDDPIILRPGISYGRVPESIPMDFAELSDDDWNILVPYHRERTSAVQGRPGRALLVADSPILATE